MAPLHLLVIPSQIKLIGHRPKYQGSCVLQRDASSCGHIAHRTVEVARERHFQKFTVIAEEDWKIGIRPNRVAATSLSTLRSRKSSFYVASGIAVSFVSPVSLESHHQEVPANALYKRIVRATVLPPSVAVGPYRWMGDCHVASCL